MGSVQVFEAAVKKLERRLESAVVEAAEKARRRRVTRLSVAGASRPLSRLRSATLLDSPTSSGNVTDRIDAARESLGRSVLGLP